MNISDTQLKAAQLTDAFRLFNQLSQTLAESYQGLEEQVAKLTQELTAARSERLKTLVEKEKLANRLQTILAALPAGVLILNDAQFIVDCNALAVDMLGEPLLGESWTEIARQRMCIMPDSPHESVLGNGKRITITNSPLDELDGQLILLTDVTEMRALQDSLNRQRQLSSMGEMVASMAHQVRTPLSTAILYASQMSKPALNEAKRVVFAEKILERLHHLDRQVNDMLIFAKEGRLTMSCFALDDLVAHINDAMSEFSRSNRIHFELTRNTQTEILQGNLNALQGALMNLVNNALEALGSKGAIAIQFTEKNSQLHIQIKDSGCGMTPEVMQRIFEPFFTTKVSGTGLGLAVVDSVIKAHGGELQCTSAPGKGTLFSIRLPCIDNSFEPQLSEFSLKLQSMMEENDHAPV